MNTATVRGGEPFFNMLRPSLAHPFAMLTSHATLKAKIVGDRTCYLASFLRWTSPNVRRENERF